MEILFCWLGLTDIKASSGDESVGLGPIAQAVLNDQYGLVTILSDHSDKVNSEYKKWLTEKTKTTINIHKADLTRPTDFGEIYESVISILKTSKEKNATDDYTFHLSPGTPAMAAVWVIISKTRFPAKLIESSKEDGTRTVSLPFDISAEYLPDLLSKPDKKLIQIGQAQAPETPEFEAIIHRSPEMKTLISKAQWISIRNVPVLIQGESGTGKELLARAIHFASPRKDKKIITINCGAIPNNLFDSEFFGYEKGAFTGADNSKEGFLEAANGGTIFLDEIGELSKFSQVKLLRAIQEGEIYRLGSNNPIKIDVRFLAATNRNLLQEIAKGNFREDLFHRLAIGSLTLPPLRNRSGDIGLLVDSFLAELNNELMDQPGFLKKNLSSKAKNRLLNHAWPGNIRELRNTLTRIMIWSTNNTITIDEIEDAIFEKIASEESILKRPLGDDFNINEVLDEVLSHYLKRAMKESNGVKTKAAKLLGLANYQTLSNWIRKYKSI